jgi:hypothetical protein
MRRILELGLTSPVEAMESFLEPYQAWIESVTGCPRSETVTLEFEFPFSHLVAEDLMALRAATGNDRIHYDEV